MSAALVLTCMRCGTAGWGVRPAPRMTAYATVDDYKRSGSKVPPNTPISQPQPPVCVHCEAEWVDYWQNMWEEYNASRL